MLTADRRLKSCSVAKRSDGCACTDSAGLRNTGGSHHIGRHSIRSIGSAVTPVASLRSRCARIVGIDDTQCRASRCRRVALWQRRVAAIVVVVPSGEDMQANRKSRIIRLGASRRRYRNHRDRQNRQSQHAHPNVPCSQTRQHSDNLVPVRERIAGPRGAGKPLQIAVDDAPGTTETARRSLTALSLCQGIAWQ